MTPDATDWAILDELQRDGRLPLTELGRRVNLSASATTERVRRLEEAGVVTGYRAVVDPSKVGYPVQAAVRLKYSGSRHEAFHQLVEQRPEIMECVRISGEDCYLLTVATTSTEALARLVDVVARFGDTTTNLVYSHTVPYRGPSRPQ